MSITRCESPCDIPPQRIVAGFRPSTHGIAHHSTSPSGLLAGSSRNPGIRAVGNGKSMITQLALRGCAPLGVASTSAAARAGRNQEQRRTTCAGSSRQGSGLARGTHRASFLKVRVKRSGTSSGSAMRACVSRCSHAGARALERCGVATAACPRVSQGRHDTARAARQWVASITASRQVQGDENYEQ